MNLQKRKVFIMEPLVETLQRQNRMLNCLTSLPRRILSVEGVDNVTEFVLHDLCQTHCFNLNKAAYFVDNPDFNCTKGIAGFCKEDSLDDPQAAWNDPLRFSEHMKASEFNQRVRGLSRCSIKKGPENHAELAEQLAKDLGFKNHAFCSWSMRHDNEGFVLYEKKDCTDSFVEDHLVNGLSLLSFCPVF